ncbi:MAG: hypothetical protein V3S11_01030, partial [Elusimicrobiota bacterium]
GASIAKAIIEVFPHVRMFRGYNGVGTHFLASLRPLPKATARQLASRMPNKARIDLMEWSGRTDPAQAFELVLRREIPLKALEPFDAAPLRDDRPFNEYFFLRAPGMALR